jgi:hypothetical protein
MLKKAFQRAIVLALPMRPSTYSDDTLTRFRVAREALRERRAPHELLAKMVRETGARHVVDYGGGAGEMARDLVAAFPEVRVTIVENEHMVRLGRPSPGVTFSRDIPKCDLFFTSAALFYVPDAWAVLDRVFRVAPVVILARNFFGEGQVCLHKMWRFDIGNGPLPPGFWNLPITFKATHLREAEIIAFAERFGFRLARSGEPPGKEYGRELVFHGTPTAVI